MTPVAGSRAASVAPFQAAGGNSIRVAFKPQEDGASRSLLMAPVQDQRDVTSAGSIAIRRTGTGDARSSSAIFLGVSPDVFQLSNPVRLLRLMFLE